MTVPDPERPLLNLPLIWPVLAQTASRLNQYAACPDDVEVRDLTELVLDDPSMAFRLLSDVDSLLDQPPTMNTVTSAILLLGIDPFLKRYAGLATVEEVLRSFPETLNEYRRLVRLSRRAARLIGAFCVPCHDVDVNALFLAGLLHALACLKRCIEHPQDVLSFQRQCPDLSETGQILDASGFPHQFVLLVTGEQERLDPQMRRVRLAIRIASALENGWSSPQLSDLLSELAGLLGLSKAATVNLVRAVPL